MDGTSNISGAIEQRRGRLVARMILTALVIILFLSNLTVLFKAAEFLKSFEGEEDRLPALMVVVSKCRAELMVLNAAAAVWVGYGGICRVKKLSLSMLGAISAFALIEICIVIFAIAEGVFSNTSGIR